MEQKKRLISNFLSLSSVQALNYILPFITVPYLVRVLGPERFGLIAFSQSFIQYFILLTDYGFNLSATREISINREDKEKVFRIFSSIMLIKLVFMFLSFLILYLFIFNIPKFRTEWLVYFFSFGMVIANALFPLWFFLGMERVKRIALFNILSKLIFTISIFIFIRSQSDYIYVPLINSLGYIFTGLISLWIVFKEFGVKLKIPTFVEIKHELEEGWQIFISTIAISLYTISTAFILGLFTNNTIVGYYSAGEKIVKAVQGLLEPLSQTIYPHISKLASESKESALSFIRKVIKVAGVLTFLLSLSLFIFAPHISHMILGSEFKESIPVIQILSFSILLIFLNIVLITHIMLNFGYQKERTKILFSAGLINITLVLILLNIFQHSGAAMSVLVTEFYITCYGVIFLSRRGFRLITR